MSEEGCLRNIVIVIPAYQPTEELLALIQELNGMGALHIVVVNDGSTSSEHIFNELRNAAQCAIVEHAVNQGKGRALKTGFNYCLVHHRDALGVVTADGDGQHAPGDIRRVAEELTRNPKRMVLGTRKFAGSIPFRSLIGNRLTKLVLRTVTGLKVTDSQTGLRALPMTVLPSLMRLEGEQFECEMNMLLAAYNMKVCLVEVPIETIYLNGNNSWHVNPFFDSMRIYFVLLRFLLSSLSTSMIDQLVFLYRSTQERAWGGA